MWESLKRIIQMDLMAPHYSNNNFKRESILEFMFKFYSLSGAINHEASGCGSEKYTVCPICNTLVDSSCKISITVILLWNAVAQIRREVNENSKNKREAKYFFLLNSFVVQTRHQLTAVAHLQT